MLSMCVGNISVRVPVYLNWVSVYVHGGIIFVSECKTEWLRLFLSGGVSLNHPSGVASLAMSTNIQPCHVKVHKYPPQPPRTVQATDHKLESAATL